MKIYVESIMLSTAKNGNEFLKIQCMTNTKTPQLFYLWDNVQSFINDFNSNNKIFEITSDNDPSFPKITGFAVTTGDINEFYTFIYPSDDYALQVYQSLYSNIADPFLKALVDTVMNQTFKNGSTVLSAFTKIPAAKAYHHNFRYGLLRHTHEVMSFVSRVCDAEIYKDALDKNLALTAALLHDVGKVYEYEFDGVNTADYGKSIEINQIYLGSHLYKGAEMVALAYADLIAINPEYAADVYDLKVQHLKHIIMSHHLQQEWGAIPKQPKTLEAYLVFTGDYFSAAFGKYSSLSWESNANGFDGTTNDMLKETSKYDNFFGFTPFIKHLETTQSE